LRFTGNGIRNCKMQRIKYISKEGEHHDQVLKIVKRLSKVIVVRHPDSDETETFTIPRGSVESIQEAKKEINGEAVNN
jgi:hypothetical protein